MQLSLTVKLNEAAGICKAKVIPYSERTRRVLFDGYPVFASHSPLSDLSQSQSLLQYDVISTGSSLTLHIDTTAHAGLGG